MAENSISWKGQSGRSYEYSVFDINANWNDVGGNYIFAKKTGSYWNVVYIGQTSSLKDRLSDHEKRPCAVRNGATHIHAHINQNRQSRLMEEEDLIKNHKPPCNDKLK